MTTYSLPNLSIQRPVPGSNEPWSTAGENADWEAVDARFGTLTSQQTAQDAATVAAQAAATKASGGLRFASSAARDASFTAPTDGDACYRTDLDAEQRYVNTAWVTVRDGMALIVPTGVGGGTIGLSGVVTATAATSLSVQNAFTTAFENYRIHVRVKTSVAASFHFTLANGLVPVSTANYDTQVVSGGGAGVAASQGLAQANWPIAATSAGVVHNFTMEIFRPRVVDVTSMFCQSFSTASPMSATNAAIQIRGGLFRLNSTFDGFRLSFDSGAGETGAGDVRIYGYA